MADDVVVGGEDPVREPIVPHELPDVLDGVEFRRSGRQRQQGDVGWHGQPGRAVPAGLIEHQDGVAARIDREADLLQVLGHGLGVAPGHDEAGAFALGRADRAEDVGPFGSLIVGRSRASSAPRPAAGDPVLLADSGLVLPPELYGGAGRELGLDLVQSGRESFLKSSSAASF